MRMAGCWCCRERCWNSTSSPSTRPCRTSSGSSPTSLRAWWSSRFHPDDLLRGVGSSLPPSAYPKEARVAIAIDATKEALAQAYAGLGTWISLHTASPGTTGASEATGGSPAYARKETEWSAGGEDGVVTGTSVIIDVPAGTYTHIGLWDAASGGNLIDTAALGSSVTMSSQGQVVLTPTFTQS